MVFRWCIALINWWTTPIAYITRLIAKKQRREDNREEREIERRILERYTIEESNWKKVIDCKKRKGQETD
jgi:hypothetical protein